MAKQPTEIYSVDMRELTTSIPTTAVLEFWWTGSIQTTEQARDHFLEFIVRQGLVLAPATTVDVKLVDEFRLLQWVVRADVVARS
jgi:hypothetical protein